jgi:hypothetical protein
MLKKSHLGLFFHAVLLLLLDAISQVGNPHIAKHLEQKAHRLPDGKITLDFVGLTVPNFDHVISALGFAFDPSPLVDLAPEMMEIGGTFDRYPAMDASYQSTNVPGLYFAGTITHGNDKGKSAGGFIHGFRYTARALSRIFLATPEAPWPASFLGCVLGYATAIEAVEDLSQQC